MCYGGGNRDAGGTWAVRSTESFGYNFARHCGYAQSITAQNGPATTRFTWTDGEFDESKVTDQYELVNGVHKGDHYKSVYEPVQWATPDSPKNPRTYTISQQSNRA